VNDGVLSKVVYEISGTMRRGDEEVDIDRTTTIEISNVNSTALDIPAEAAAKLNK